MSIVVHQISRTFSSRINSFLMVCFLLYFISITIYPHYTLFHLPHRPSPHNYHTVVHVHEFFFFFAQTLHPFNIPPRAVNLLSICESVPILPVIQLAHFIRFHTWGESYGICLSLTGLISLSIMFSRSINAVTKGKTSFFFKAEYYPTV